MNTNFIINTIYQSWSVLKQLIALTNIFVENFPCTVVPEVIDFKKWRFAGCLCDFNQHLAT